MRALVIKDMATEDTLLVQELVPEVDLQLVNGDLITIVKSDAPTLTYEIQRIELQLTASVNNPRIIWIWVALSEKDTSPVYEC